MAHKFKINYVSDIACPWCAVGLYGLEIALERVRDIVQAEIIFQPFELNPRMPAGGQNIVDYVVEKYGSTRQQSELDRATLRARAADVKFEMNISENSRMYNTRDAHRLLRWATQNGSQLALKHRLFEANFTNNLDISDPDVLIQVAQSAGLDPDLADEVLSSGRFTADVEQSENVWRLRGISSVPSIIFGSDFLISGGQTADSFERSLRGFVADSEYSMS